MLGPEVSGVRHQKEKLLRRAEKREVAKLFHILSQEVQKSEESLKSDLLVKIVVVIEQIDIRSCRK